MNGVPAALDFIKAAGRLDAARTAPGTLEEIGKSLSLVVAEYAG
jgi:hypothetical protein